MGWNVVSAAPGSVLFAGVESERFYFVHSYAAAARPGDTVAEHGSPFAAAVERGCLVGDPVPPREERRRRRPAAANWLGRAVSLILLPAVDVTAGQAVRLVQGEAGSETGYGDPLEAALRWQHDGAEWVHLVDLDAAFGRG